MTLKRVKFKSSDEGNRGFRSAMLAAAKHEPRRSMSNRRLIGSGLSIFAGLFFAYTAMFYVPAFFNFQKTLGISSQDIKIGGLGSTEESSNPLKAYTDIFKLRRGYFRSGQVIQVGYEISPGTKLSLEIKKCNSAPILEIIHCDSFQTQTIDVSEPLRGAQSFRVSEPGFYYYSEQITDTAGQSTSKPFVVVWRRHQI